VKENVDVAIVEVGIGGQYDSTNIIKNTEIVGIAPLQLEHTQLLGETIDEIAWQKAGIIKENSHVFTVQQPPVCLKVINKRFIEKKGKSLSVTPAFEDYKWTTSSPDFSKTSEVNKINFSLAAQLSGRWLRNRNKITTNLFEDNVLHSINDKFVEAFNTCQFDGRYQRIEQENLTFFLDGAHTKDSMEICTNWFSKQIEGKKDVVNVLVFNVTGDRDSAAILSSLHSLNFHYVLFSTNISNSDSENGTCENFNGALNNAQLDRCIKHREIWQTISKSKDNVSVCATIQDALELIHDIKDNNQSTHVNVLFTGSLHLIGSCLGQLNCSVERKAKAAAKAKRART